MTLVLKLDLDIVKMYHHTKNEVSMSTHSKVITWTDRQTDTDTHDETILLPHTREVIINLPDHRRWWWLHFCSRCGKDVSPSRTWRNESLTFLCHWTILEYSSPQLTAVTWNDTIKGHFKFVVPTFSDWLISLTFPAFSFHFPVFFSVFI